MLEEEKELLKIIRENKFERIADAIELMWGYPELETYFANLSLDDRGNRAGFPPIVFKAIHKLSFEHHKQFGKKDTDIWSVF